MKFIQARVNGGSNYDSQPVREAIVGDINEDGFLFISVLCLLVDLANFHCGRPAATQPGTVNPFILMKGNTVWSQSTAR